MPRLDTAEAYVVIVVFSMFGLEYLGRFATWVHGLWVQWDELTDDEDDEPTQAA